MASDIHFTPAAPVRWCHLISARTQLDESKPKAWTCELVLDNNDAKHKAFLAKLDQIFTDTHGTKKKRSDKGQPWKPDKDDPTKTVVKFKALEFVREDGSKATGPQIIDAKRQAWDGSQIGNNSQLIIKFSTYGWERPEGTGLSLQPKAAQVLTFVAREQDDATDGFEEQDGYSVTQPIGFVDEFAEEEAPF
ncbi:MAG: hypothetical protein WCQ20_14920 [Synechococcaceae cyanobacterium ELA739]|jgi:hypothetical protein